ncbi:hypothetical protein GQX73_g10408 [Xylaria multiplex]|uniref:Uncharacterized protein n=1 Tax=Xylaria multiplex TaxID=323545 RepID=A0A7C8IL52_9PEZI|nr:hypothetical protein GQX73_g10408 [Xylaria multiplex]
MPPLTGFVFFTEISDIIKDALLGHVDNGEGEPTDEIIRGNFKKLIMSAMSNVEFLYAPDLDQFVLAISRELHLLPDTVIDLLCFVIDARGYFKFLDLVDCESGLSRRADFLSRYVDLELLKSLKGSLVATAAADLQDDAIDGDEAHQSDNLCHDVLASTASAEPKTNTLMEEVHGIQQTPYEAEKRLRDNKRNDDQPSRGVEGLENLTVENPDNLVGNITRTTEKDYEQETADNNNTF